MLFRLISQLLRNWALQNIGDSEITSNHKTIKWAPQREIPFGIIGDPDPSSFVYLENRFKEVRCFPAVGEENLGYFLENFDLSFPLQNIIWVKSFFFYRLPVRWNLKCCSPQKTTIQHWSRIPSFGHGTRPKLKYVDHPEYHVII